MIKYPSKGLQTHEDVVSHFESECNGNLGTFTQFKLLGKHIADEIGTMVWVEAPRDGYFMFYGDGCYQAYSDETCSTKAKVVYETGKYAGKEDYMANAWGIVCSYKIKKGQKLYFAGGSSWNTGMKIAFAYTDDKLDEPIVKMAGTNVIAGYASAGDKICVKQGKKTFSAVADETGLYIIKVKTMKKGSKVTLWNSTDKDAAITVKIK